MDSRGICPEGFPEPSLEDWEELIAFLEDQGYTNDRNVKKNASSALSSCRQVNSLLGGDCATDESPRRHDDCFLISTV